jgi:tetratricopeptide (TPR) repeat protein
MLAGRYRIVRPIGAGGMGEVYEAEDIELGTPVAVKTMRMHQPDALAHFKREVQLARTVTHPNVCRIFDLHRHHEPESGNVVTFLTMELVPGETLTDYLARRGALSPSETLPIAQQIGDGLAAAHEKGVVHGDLKSGNVILTETGSADGRLSITDSQGSVTYGRLRAVVTDFGLAHAATQTTESSVTIAGTPAYMAPEQFEGKSVTTAADLYAFGVLLYEMVAGCRPFTGSSPIVLALDKIRKEPPAAGDIVPALPPVWSAVIRRLMDPDPGRRFGDVHDALALLQENVRRRPIIRISRKAKRLAVALLVLSLSLSLAVWLYAQSVYSPAVEALRLYGLGAHAQQLGLPWKATQLYEQSLARDDRFIAARAQLAECWMDLDQPRRAVNELQKASATRPQWQRVADYELWLEKAAAARLRGNLKEAAVFHQRASAAVPESEKPNVLMSEAAANALAGDIAEAIIEYSALEKQENNSRTRCVAMLRRAPLMRAAKAFEVRHLFEDAETCFNAAGDLDGLAQGLYVHMTLSSFFQRSDVNSIRRALLIAQSTGNVEQRILAGELLSKMLLQIGETEDSYAVFSRSMQIADQNGLDFLTARLLNDRAQYYFDAGNFLEADNAGALALPVSQAADMPWTLVECDLRRAAIALRMGLPNATRKYLAHAKEKLRLFPNAALAVRVTQLEESLKQIRSRPELTP